MDLHIPELDTLRELLTNFATHSSIRSEESTESTDYPFLSFEICGAVLQRTNGDVVRAPSEELSDFDSFHSTVHENDLFQLPGR